MRGGRTLLLSGQVALDAQGEVVGAGDFVAQARQVFRNIELALTEVGCTFDHLVKLTFFLTDVARLPEMRAVRDGFVNLAAPPASSAVQVAALGPGAPRAADRGRGGGRRSLKLYPDSCGGGDWR